MSKRPSHASVANGAATQDDSTSAAADFDRCMLSFPISGFPHPLGIIIAYGFCRTQKKDISAGSRQVFANMARQSAAHDKQKILFSTDAGHFSLIRAMHLADLITELNG